MAGASVLRKIAWSGLGTAGLIGSLYFSGNEWAHRVLFMPCLHSLGAERAHKVAVKAAKLGLVPLFFRNDPPELRTKLWNREFSNPIGIAAGFDKHAEAIPGLFRMGFGFVEIGSVTPQPQMGNPLPRVFRLAQDKAVVNRYGFNSVGLEKVEKQLRMWKESPSKSDGLLGANLGKNKETEKASDDYILGVRSLGPHADYIVINVSSPNTPGLRDYQKQDALREIIHKVCVECDKLHNRPPLLVKISPDLSAQERVDIAAVVSTGGVGVDGLVVSNTTLSRPATLQSVHREEKGGLSGEPLKDLATEVIRDMYRLTDGKIPIIGVGGVSSGKDAFEKICAGASLIQVYTALVFQGPTLVPRMKGELATLLR